MLVLVTLVKIFKLGLSEDMYEDGFESITNIDISNTVINFMKENVLTRCPNMICILLLIQIAVWMFLRCLIFNLVNIT